MKKAVVVLAMISTFTGAGLASAGDIPYAAAGLYKGTGANGKACLVESRNDGSDYGKGVTIYAPNYGISGYSFFPGSNEKKQSGCGQTPYVKGNSVAYVSKEEEMTMNFLGALLTYTGPDHKNLESVKTKRGGEAILQIVACARYNNKKWDAECNGLKAIDKKEFDQIKAEFRPEDKPRKKAVAAPENDGSTSMDVQQAD